MQQIDELIATLSEAPAPQRKVTSPYLLLLKWVMGTSVYMVALLLYFGVREDFLIKLESPLFSAELIALTCILITSFFSASILSFPDIHQKPMLAWLPLIPLQAFAGIIYASWINDIPPSPAPEHDYICLICIVMFSLLPALVMMTALRKYATTHYHLTGCIALLASGALGCLILRISEQTDSISHIVLWHYMPMIALAAAGVWIGQKVLKW